MRVPWSDAGDGRMAPLLPGGFRRQGRMMLYTPLLLLDTGADGTVVPRYNAKQLGFSDADLEPADCGVAGTTVRMYRPSNMTGTEVEINGEWLTLPSLMFANQILHPLLGRDVIFKYFNLHMTASDFELVRV